MAVYRAINVNKDDNQVGVCGAESTLSSEPSASSCSFGQYQMGCLFSHRYQGWNVFYFKQKVAGEGKIKGSKSLPRAVISNQGELNTALATLTRLGSVSKKQQAKRLESKVKSKLKIKKEKVKRKGKSKK